MVEDGADIGTEGRSLVSLPRNAVVGEFGEAHAGAAVAAVTVLDPSSGPGRDARRLRALGGGNRNGGIH